MKLYFKGEYDGNPDSLPCREHHPNANPLDNEGDDDDKFMDRLNFISIIIDVVIFLLFCKISGGKSFDMNGVFLSLLSLIPHELLHAICFKDEVFVYFWKKKLSMFVVGTESMSKMRFIIMSLLPNFIFGFLPFIIYIFNPTMTLLGSMGVFTIGMGVVDYYNVIKVIKRMPNGAKVYLYKFKSYWYMLENQ